MNTPLLLQPSVPGRDQPEAAPAATGAPTSETVAAEKGVAGPAKGPGGFFSNPAFLLLLVGMAAMLWWTTRSEKKKQEALSESLKKGDRVTTHSGLIGKIVEVADKTVRLEIAPGVVVTMQKRTILGPDGGETLTPSSAKAKDGKDSKDKSKKKS